MKQDHSFHPSFMRGRTALRVLAWCLVPAALIVNSCGGDDDVIEDTDASDGGKRDGSTDARNDATDAARDGDAGTTPTTDSSLDALPEATHPDAGDASIDVVGDVTADRIDGAIDGGADVRNDATDGADARVDATDARPDVTDGGAPDVTADALIDARSDVVEASVPEAEAAAPEAAVEASVDAAREATVDAGPTGFTFNNSVEGWTLDDSPEDYDGGLPTLGTSTANAANSLAINFPQDADGPLGISVNAPASLHVGSVVSVRIYIPAGVANLMHIYDMDSNDHWDDSTFSSDGDIGAPFEFDGWHTYTHTLRANAAEGQARTAFSRIGVNFLGITPGIIYIDSITWQ